VVGVCVCGSECEVHQAQMNVKEEGKGKQPRSSYALDGRQGKSSGVCAHSRL